MSVELYAAVTSLVGVLLGGGLSYVVQRATHRLADRSEAQRQALARTEARRAERAALVERFLISTQDAERAAFDRYHGNMEDSWSARATAAMDRVWIAEKMVRILCTPAMHDAAHEFANVLNRAILESPSEASVPDYLHPSREAVLVAARTELEASSPLESAKLIGGPAR